MAEPELTRHELLRLLTQSSPGTPMGTLLRSFWQPIALAESIKPGKARALRVLSEDLTLYRGETGTPYLVGARCAHRCTVLPHRLGSSRSDSLHVSRLALRRNGPMYGNAGRAAPAG